MRATVAVVLGAAAISSPLTAFGDQKTQEIKVDTDCRTYRPGVLGASADCEIRKNHLIQEESYQLERDGQRLKDDGRQLREEGRKIELQMTCYKKIQDRVDNIKATRTLAEQEKVALRSEKLKCDNMPKP